jgi:predicted AlkP superfamily phosphohydrolase/phosphomutase/predicted Zn-dependent protease
MLSSSNRRLLLVGWDAADWTLIHPLLDAGLMPNLGKLIEDGVMGKIETLQPALSPMLWNSIATGKTADHHGILGFLEPDPVTGGARPVTSSSRKAKALWNILDQAGFRSLVLNWFASHPAEPVRGACVSNLFPKATAPWHQSWPMVPNAVHPASLAETLAELRVHMGELTGDDLLPFIPHLAEIDQQTDARPRDLAVVLAETISIQAAATWLMENQPWDFAAVYFDAIDRAGHGFMQCQPPRMEGVSEQDFENYKGVMKGVYCFHDLMLGRLVDLAGSNATIIVVSDHGFATGAYRPDLRPGGQDRPIAWHRSHGVFCMAGPGIRKDELVYGAGLLDIAPTILTLFGLPVGADMPGRVLTEAFEEPPATCSVPTWENSGSPDSPAVTTDESDPWAAAAVLAQLADLGYIDVTNENSQRQLDIIRKDRDFNLATVYLSRGRTADAVPILERFYAEAAEPQKSLLQTYLAQALYRMNRFAESQSLAGDLLSRQPDSAAANVIRGNLALAQGDEDLGFACLRKAEEGWREFPRMLQTPGRIYLRARRWDDAERCFRAVIAYDPDMAEAHAGIARCLLEKGQLQEAADEALEAIGLKFDLPGSHYVLGVSLARVGRIDRAVQALETCLSHAPNTVLAHEWLAAIHEQATHDLARAAGHRTRIAELTDAMRRAA